MHRDVLVHLSKFVMRATQGYHVAIAKQALASDRRGRRNIKQPRENS
jgi:hypothetical protein